MTMDIKHLRTLVSIADHQSFQAAARALHMSVSNVSLHIAGLENHVGTQLFDRSSRPPKLTSAGLEIVARGRHLLNDWEELTNSVQTQDGGGVLKVGSVHTAVAGGVARSLGSLRRSHPEIYIELQTGLTSDLGNLVESNQIDCAVVTRDRSKTQHLAFHPLAEEELGVVAHQSAKGKTYREVLSTNPYLRFNRNATLALLIDEELKRRRIRVSSTMEITTLDAIESLVMNGIGVSIIPLGRNVRKLPKNVRTLPFSRPALVRSLGVLHRPDTPRKHLVEHLLSALHSVYRTT